MCLQMLRPGEFSLCIPYASTISRYSHYENLVVCGPVEHRIHNESTTTQNRMGLAKKKHKQQINVKFYLFLTSINLDGSPISFNNYDLTI